MLARPILLLAFTTTGAAACGSGEPAPTVPVVAIASAAPATALPEPATDPDPPAAPKRSARPPETTPPPAATGTPLEQARELFRQGVVRYSAGSYAAARDAFLAAYRRSPHPKVLYNAANAAYHANDLHGACTLLAQWRQEANPSPAELAAVDAGLQQRCP
jgi:hypothetical protein